GHVWTLCTELRIRRLGVRVPSGAPPIKVVTSENAGRGLDSFPTCAAIFHIVGPWCSSGARLFRNGPCRPGPARVGRCRSVRILNDGTVRRAGVDRAQKGVRLVRGTAPCQEHTSVFGAAGPARDAFMRRQGGAPRPSWCSGRRPPTCLALP